MYGYVYKCTYKDKIYIGESINALNPGYLGTGGYWRSIIKGHEKEITKEILETIEASDIKLLKAKMHEREIYWISVYDSTNPNIGYNISPGGNIMTERSKQKMKEADSKAIKHIMETTDCKQRISDSMKKHRKKYGFSDEHLQKISNSLKGRKVGCPGDSRSIQVYCIVNGEKHSFHNKITAAKWWFENYPFSDSYAEITYTRMISKSIRGEPLRYHKKPISQNIKWFEEIFELSINSPVYCEFNGKIFEFDTISNAIIWWHNNYPITKDFNKEVYIDKLIKNIKGFEITRNSKSFKDIQWFRKEIL